MKLLLGVVCIELLYSSVLIKPSSLIFHFEDESLQSTIDCVEYFEHVYNVTFLCIYSVTHTIYTITHENNMQGQLHLDCQPLTMFSFFQFQLYETCQQKAIENEMQRAIKFPIFKNQGTSKIDLNMFLDGICSCLLIGRCSPMAKELGNNLAVFTKKTRNFTKHIVVHEKMRISKRCHHLFLGTPLL